VRRSREEIIMDALSLEGAIVQRISPLSSNTARGMTRPRADLIFFCCFSSYGIVRSFQPFNPNIIAPIFLTQRHIVTNPRSIILMHIAAEKKYFKTFIKLQECS